MTGPARENASVRLTSWAGKRHDFAPLAHADLAVRTIAMLTENVRAPMWGCYLAHAAGDVVGTCAFKDAPDDEGVVEIAYMTFPPFQRRGHAKAMIAALLRIADAGGAEVVIAHTKPRMNASSRALRRSGFAHADAFTDPDDGPVWYWERVLDRAGA